MPRLAPHTITLAEAAKIAGGKLQRGAATMRITAATTPAEAVAGSICFITKPKMIDGLANSAKLACLTSPALANQLPNKVAIITHNGDDDQIKDDFAKIMLVLYPPITSQSGGIHRSAIIAEDAQLGKGVGVEALVVIGKGVVIGAGCLIQAGAVIGDDVVIGDGSLIEARTTISHARIGKHVHISQGASIGHCGFGLSKAGKLLPHVGGVVLGDYVYIGANTNIDRGMLGDTKLEDHVMVDSLCHIAHNVVIGAGSVICGQTGFGGSSSLGAGNTLGPQVGVASHVHVGKGNLFAARSGITRSIGDNTVMGGFPAVPMADYRMQMAGLRKLARSMQTTKKTTTGE